MSFQIPNRKLLKNNKEHMLILHPHFIKVFNNAQEIVWTALATIKRAIGYNIAGKLTYK